MNDNDLIREARACYAALPAKLAWALADALDAANTRVARIEKLLEHVDAARAGYDALVARANRLEKALREVARFDTSCDLDAVTCSIIAHDALAGVPDEPETEEKP